MLTIICTLENWDAFVKWYDLIQQVFRFANFWHSIPDALNATAEGSSLDLNFMALHPLGKILSHVT